MTDQDPTQRLDAPPPRPPPPAPPPPRRSRRPPPARGPDLRACRGAAGPDRDHPGRRRREAPGPEPVRWVAAGVLTLVVAGTAAAATLLLTGGSGDLGPRLDPGRLRRLHGAPPRPARRPARRARGGHAGLPGLRRPGRVPDQDQRGARPARLAARRTASSRGRADIEPWFGGQLAAERRRPADQRRRRGLGAGPRPRRRQGRDEGQGLGGRLAAKDGATTATETYNGVDDHDDHPAGRRRGHAEGSRRATRSSGRCSRWRRRLGQGRDRHQRQDAASRPTSSSRPRPRR